MSSKTQNNESGRGDSYFTEKNEVIDVITSISSESWKEAYMGKFDWLNTILSKYQEQPLLLNPCLPELTRPMTEKLKDIVHQTITNVPSDFSKSDSFQQMNAICKVFQVLCRVRGYKHVMKQLSHEVDTLEPCFYFLQQQDWFDYTNWETKYVFLLWLRMLCLIPFDICSIDSTITTSTTVAQTLSGENMIVKASSSKLVLSIVSYCRTCLVDTGPTRDSAALCLSTLLTRPDMETGVLNEFCQNCINTFRSWLNRGTTAASELSQKSFEMVGILQCACQVFKTGHRNKILPYASSLLEVILQLSKQPNQILVRKLVTKLTQRIGMTFLPPRVVTWRYQRGQRSLVTNLSVVSTTPLADTTSSKTTVVEGKLQEEKEEEEEKVEDIPTEMDDIFEYLLTALGDKDTVVRWSAAKGIGRLTSRLPKQLADDLVAALLQSFTQVEAVAEESDSIWHGGCLALAELARRGALLPSRLDETVPIVISAMKYDVIRGYHSVGAHVRDAACYVCWAFARAYSPQVLRKYMVDLNDSDNETSNSISLSAAMLTTSLFDREVNCRRAAAAAYQENVGRQGNQNFTHGLEIIAIADYFSLGSRKGAYTKIAICIASLSVSNYMLIWKHLIHEKLGHWDIEIRSLATESIGKLVLQLKESHLQSAQQFVISDLTNLFVPNSLNPSSPSLRHGSILAVSECMISLSQLGMLPRLFNTAQQQLQENQQLNNNLLLSTETIYAIVAIVSELNRLRLYRGKGSEYLRIASCKLIGSIATCSLSIRQFGINATTARKHQIALLEALNENIKQPHEAIQLAAQEALRLYLYTYFRNTTNDSNNNSNNAANKEKIESLTIVKYLEGILKEENVAVTRGYTLALATLPVCMILSEKDRITLNTSASPIELTTSSTATELNGLDSSSNNSMETEKLIGKVPENRLGKILYTLKEMSSVDHKIGGEADSETRRNSLLALTELTERLLSILPYSVVIPPNNEIVIVYDYVWNILVDGSHDYSSDKRGDTGSWSRMVALQGLERLVAIRRHLLLLSTLKQTMISSIFSELFIGSMVDSVYGRGIIESMDKEKGVVYVSYPNPSLYTVISHSDSKRLVYAHISNLTLSSQKTVSSQSVTSYPIASHRITSLLNLIKPVVPSYEQHLLILCLRQLAEKLDSVRECAGRIIERLLCPVDIPISSRGVEEDPKVLSIAVDMNIPSYLILGKDILTTCITIAKTRINIISKASSINNIEISTSRSITTPLADNNDEDDGDRSDDGDKDNNNMNLSSFSLQWSKSSHVFPFLRDILLLLPDYYLQSIISGLVMSIGGLSETIAKEALQAVIDFHNSIVKYGIVSNRYKIHKLFLNTIVDMLSSSISNKKLDRVSAPILKTIDLLYKNQIINPMISYYDYILSQRIEENILKIVITTTVIAKLRSSIEILLHLLTTHGSLRYVALTAIINLLGHKFPKIRSYAAEVLYLACISDPSPISEITARKAKALWDNNSYQSIYDSNALNDSRDSIDSKSGLISCSYANTMVLFEEATNILASAPWNDVDIEVVRQYRLKLCELFDIDLSTVKQGSATMSDAKSTSTTANINVNPNKKKGKNQDMDELDSYSSLVREAGY